MNLQIGPNIQALGFEASHVFALCERISAHIADLDLRRGYASCGRNGQATRPIRRSNRLEATETAVS
jgi:hypothetical protein